VNEMVILQGLHACKDVTLDHHHYDLVRVQFDRADGESGWLSLAGSNVAEDTFEVGKKYLFRIQEDES